MAITNQAEADANIKASNENKILSEQYYNAFKQTVKNSNAQYDIIQSQLAPLKDDSTIEGLQKKIELRKNLAEIASASIADSKTYFMQMNDLSSPGYGQTDNRPVYLKNMAENLKLQQAAIDSNDKKIANLETTLNQITSKQSATEEETAKAKAAEEATKPPPPANTADPNKDALGPADDDKGTSNKASTAGLKTNEVTTPDVANTTTASANKNASTAKAQTTADVYNGLKVDVTGYNNSGSSGGIGLRDFNPLSKIPDYTYNITLSVASPDVYNRWVEGDKKAIDDAPVVVRSGGTSKTKAKGFELECYIDELEFETLVSSKEEQASTNSFKYKFKIFEPYGFSVPSSLAKLRNSNAVGLENFRGTFFLTVKFYGWGNLKFGDAGSSNSPPELHERTFCIYITKVNFKLDRGLVVYDISAVQFTDKVAKGNKGEIKVTHTVQGSTVKDFLIGDESKSTKEVISLVTALNTEEKEQKDKSKITVRNVYKIEILDDDLANALVIDENWAKGRVPFAPIDKSSQVNAQLSYENTFVFAKPALKQVTFTAGTTILKAIDNIISQSSYVRNALTGKKEEGDTATEKKSKQEVLSWYNITPSVKYIPTGSGPDGKDPLVNDFAYEITYRIQRYEIPYIKSVYADQTMKYYGPYKRYQYWYTGHNTEVLSFDMNYDYSYQVDESSNSSSSITTKSLDGTPVARKPPAADINGRDQGTNEEVNNIRSWLYSPGDTVKWNLTILGDPDYLMPAHTGSIVDQMKDWYGEDFTINPGAGQIFIEIDFRQAKDYNKAEGLLQIDDQIKFMDYPTSMDPKPKGFVFYVTKVVSTFSRGRFEQKLTGGLPSFGQAGKYGKNDTTIASTEDSNPGRSAGYNSYGTNNGSAAPNSMPGVVAQGSFGDYTEITNQPVTTVTNAQQTGIFSNPVYSSIPAQDTTTATNANDDQSVNNQPTEVFTSNDGGREPVYKADVAFGRGNVPIAAGQRNVIPTLG
jgi:hypothetical protein